MSSTPPSLQANADLLSAAKEGDVGGIRAALASGADALDRALAWACVNNQPLAASYLLDRGAQPNAIFNQGALEGIDEEDESAPKERAAGDVGREEGAAVLEPDTSSLAHIASSGYGEVIDLLLERGLDLRENDHASEAAVCGAALEGRADIATSLLDAGAWFEGGWFDRSEEAEKRVLEWSAREGCPELAETLLERGAPMDAERIARDRSRVYYVMRTEEHGRVFDLLRERGYQPSNREVIQYRSRWFTKALAILSLAPLLVLFMAFATVAVTAILLVQAAMLPFLLGGYMWRRARGEGPRLFRRAA